MHKDGLEEARSRLLHTYALHVVASESVYVRDDQEWQLEPRSRSLALRSNTNHESLLHGVARGQFPELHVRPHRAAHDGNLLCLYFLVPRCHVCDPRLCAQGIATETAASSGKSLRAAALCIVRLELFNLAHMTTVAQQDPRIVTHTL